MEDKDILKLRKILYYKKRDDLAELFAFSTSYLNVSNTYGSRSYSQLSCFEIFSPVEMQAKIDEVSDEDKYLIYNAIKQIYPTRDNEPEVNQVEYLVNFDLDSTALVETKELTRINFNYIHEQIQKCNSKIAHKDFDGAVTNARALIESVCLFILEAKLNEKQNYDGKLLKLFKTVSSVLKMSPGDYDDDNLKQILTGTFSIINGISGLRNNYSDAHGTSPSKTYKIDERHAILSVNIAKTITEYLFLTFERSEKK